MMAFSLSKHPVREKRVLVRADFNVPIRGRQILDSYKVKRVLPTLRALLRGKNVIILLSHHSRDSQSLSVLQPLLGRVLGRHVFFLRNPFSAASRAVLARAKPGNVFLAENLRFWRGEKKNDPKFSRRLAGLGQVFVNDAFAEFHRPYASMVGLPRFLPSRLGLLAEEELGVLHKLLRSPRRPFVAVVGGAKFEDKLGLIRKFLIQADTLLLAGLPAALILGLAGGILLTGAKISPSVKRVLGALIRWPRFKKKAVLPVDARVESKEIKQVRLKDISEISAGEIMRDIGPKTEKEFARVIGRARTILWNGTLGQIEKPQFSRGSASLARAIGRSRAYRVAGGGDTVGFLHSHRLAKNFDYLSTGGGAMLAYLSGEALPALEALKKNSKFKAQNSK